MKMNSISRVLCLQLFICFSAASQSQDSMMVVPLWPNGAPGFENKKNEPEVAKDWYVKNINNPSITVFLPPKDKANGAAVVICPGGGHRALGYKGEGVEPAKYFNSLGIAAFVLKYRLFREENSPYKEENAKQDGFRAMRLVRSKAAEWGLDSARIGMMGFSAGGETVEWVAYDEGKGDPTSKDKVERFCSKPSFQILIYPGPLGVPEKVPKDAPPAFLLVANEDACCSAPVVALLSKYRDAKVPVETHIYSVGDHAFNMGTRSTFNSLKNWTQRLTDWLNDNGWMTAKKKQ